MSFFTRFADLPPDALKLETVKKAFEENLRRMASRRVKYIRITLDGEPKNEFPPLDSPDRMQVIDVRSDGRMDGQMRIPERFFVQLSTFQTGALWKASIESWDGSKTTSLRTEPIKGQLRTTAEIRGSYSGSHSELWVFEMGVRDLVEGLEFKRLGIRSSLKPSPLGEGLVELNPRVDDRSSEQERYTLDPMKNYWPVRYDSESRSHDGKVTKRSMAVAEFISDPKLLYPKRVTSYWSDNRRTYYYTAQSAEFPEKLDDDAFAVAIPDGVVVTDNVGRKTYTQGSGMRRRSGSPPHQDCGTPRKIFASDDWAYYGGFFGAIAAFVIGILFFFSRQRRKSD